METVLTEFWTELFGVNSKSGHIYDFVELILVGTTQLAGVIAFIYIAYKVMLYFSDIDTRLDPFVIIRPCILLGVLALYSDLVDLVLRRPITFVTQMMTDGVTGLSLPTPSAGPSIDTSTTAGKFEAVMTYVDISTGPGWGIFDILAINPMLELIHVLIYLTATVVGAYMMFRQIILIAIYYIIGTIAIPFSMIAGNQSVFGNWFFGFVSVMLWRPIYFIMQVIIIALDPSAKTFTSPLFAIALQIVMILTILQIPKFANILVSKGSELGQGVGKNVMGNMGRMFK